MHNFQTVQTYVARGLITLCEQEPLFDVINERGELLMAGVTHTRAIQAIDAQQRQRHVPLRWQGEMRIKVQRDPRRGGGAA